MRHNLSAIRIRKACRAHPILRHYPGEPRLASHLAVRPIHPGGRVAVIKDVVGGMVPGRRQQRGVKLKGLDTRQAAVEVEPLQRELLWGAAWRCCRCPAIYERQREHKRLARTGLRVHWYRQKQRGEQKKRGQMSERLG